MRINHNKKYKSLILLSGGIDSAIAAMLTMEKDKDVLFLTFDYDQINKMELICANNIINYFNAEKHHIVHKLDLNYLTRCKHNSALITQTDAAKSTNAEYYVPGRNIIFLANAVSIAEAYDIQNIIFGSNSQETFPDASEDFLKLFEKAARVGLKYNNAIKIYSPTKHMTKFDAIRYGFDHRFDYRNTWTCYTQGPLACGKCLTCRSRILNFHWAGLEDPIKYVKPYREVLKDLFLM